MADAPFARTSPDTPREHLGGPLDDDELLFDDDLLAEDLEDGEALEILDEIRLDDADVSTTVFDKDALVRRDVWNGLVHCIVSNAQLWSTVDVAEVKELMAGPIDVLPREPLLLEPLWRYMIAKGTPKKAAAETLLFFHSRAARWNVTFVLPAAMDELRDETRAAVADKLSARGVTTGTFVGMAPVAPKKAKRQKLRAPRVGDGSGVRRFLVRVAVLAVLAGAAYATMKLTEPEDVSARASAALGAVCTHAVQHGGAVLCTTDAITLATVGPLHERRAITETALDVTVVFVDKHGALLPLPAPR